MKKYLLNIIIFSSLLFAQEVYWVDGTNGNDSNNGTSEATAFKTVKKAFSQSFSANFVDTIKVKAGTYDFEDDEIYTSSNRDFVLIGVGGSANTIFTAGHENRHMSIDDGQSNKTKIQGITFTKGKADNWPGGGSIVISGGSDVQFIDCVWKDNIAAYYNGAGAVMIRDGSNPTFTSCVFDSNWVDLDASGETNYGYGGAIRIDGSNSKTDLETPIVIKKSKFTNNYILSNRGAYGGAISSEKALTIENSIFIKNYLITHIDGTSQDAMGGAIYFDATRWNNSSYDGGNMYITNSTFHGNYIDSKSEQFGNLFGAAIAYGRWANSSSSKSWIFNTVITGSRSLINGQPWITTSDDQLKKLIVGAGNESGYKMNLEYSIVQAPKTGTGWGDYVYDITPGYKDTANGDYSLSDKSPLIGAGVTKWEDEDIPAPTEDLLGNARPNPSGSNPDIGAYENTLSSSSAPLPVIGLNVARATGGAKLSWSKNKEKLGSSTDASDIEYQIYVDGSNVAQTTATSYQVTGLTNGTTYKVSVSAKNTSSNIESILSVAKSVIPRYLGPWHIANSGGKALSDTLTNFSYGSYDYPINHLGNALEIASSGDTIIFKKGTHTGSNNRGTNFTSSKKFVISGDLNYSPDQTVIDAAGKDRHFKFDYGNGADSTFVIQHITLYNGFSSDTYYGGGSIYINGGSPKLHKVIFKANLDSSNSSWQSGGAVLVTSQGSVIVDSCVFDGNRVSKYSTNSTENESFNNYAHGAGIGFYNTYSRSIIRASTFKNNKAYSRTSAEGSAIYMQNDAVDITNSLFYNNETRSSVGNGNQGYSSNGAVAYGNGPQIRAGNDWDGATAIFANNTVANNSATSESNNAWTMSGVYYCSHDNNDTDAVLYAYNNIIYGNTKTDNGQTKVEEYQLQLHCGNPIVRNDYNLIYNAKNLKDGPGSGSKYYNFDYTIDSDPGFTDADGGDFSLGNASLAIGAGVADWSDWGVKAPAKDMLGGVRPNPSGSAPDLGPYENSLASSPYPRPVKNVTAVGGSGSVTLTWDAVSGSGIKYKVYKHTSAFSVSSTYYVGQTENTSYTITGLDNATRYYFRVSAVNSDGYEGTASNSIDITPTYSGPVWWVATDGNDNTGEGSSGNPYKSLKHALKHVSSGDTVMLKPGTYSGPENRDIRFNPDEGYSKYKNLVITSEKGAAETIIDAGKQARHFYITTNSNGSIDSTLQFIGLTFINGRETQGGSFYFEADYYYSNSINTNIAIQLSPKFVNCVFKNNITEGDQGGGGGAFVIRQASPIFESCVFDSNRAYNGGAISIEGNSDVVVMDTLWIRNSTIKNNIATNDPNTSNSVTGGGISMSFGRKAVIINSVFENNVASVISGNGSVSGGGLFIGDWSPKAHPMTWIVNSRFSKNKTNHLGGNTNSHGAGMYLSSPHVILNTVVDSNIASFDGGNGAGMGGGMFIAVKSQFDNSGEIRGQSFLINNTIVNNIVTSKTQIGRAGGIDLQQSEQVEGVWFNNIIWGNRSNFDINDPNGWQQRGRNNITDIYQNEGYDLVSGYNNIEFLEAYVDGNNGWNFWNQNNNSLSLDPGFVNPASNYRLTDASPLIGAGVNTYDGTGTFNKDILGNIRPTPDGSNPDLGAYENKLATSPYPKQVEIVKATPRSGSVELTWLASKEDDIDKYNIYVSTIENFIPAPEFLEASTSDTNYTVTGLTNGSEYFFRVAAVDKDGNIGTGSATLKIIPKFNGPSWWVSNAGKDTNDGDEVSPLKSLKEAFKRIASGDTINIKAGIYGGNDNIGFYDSQIFDSGFGNDPNSAPPNSEVTLTIRGATGNAKDVVFDGNAEGGNNAQRFFYFDRQFDDVITFENLTFQNEYHNGDSQNSNSGGGAIKFNQAFTELTFRNVIFKDNVADQTDYHGGGGAVNIRVQKGKTPPKFIRCSFIGNESRGANVTNNPSGSSLGGAVVIEPGWGGVETTTENEKAVIFDQCYFEGNVVRSDYSEDVTGAAIQSQANIMIFNSVFTSNTYKINGQLQNGWQSTVWLMPQYVINNDDAGIRASGRAVLINNTFYNNKLPNELQVSSSDQNKLYLALYNNIFDYDQGDGVELHGNNTPIEIYRGSNLFTNSEEQSHYAYDDQMSLILEEDLDDFTGEPLFKGELVNNFQLRPNSPAIDKGVQSWPDAVTKGYGGNKAPVFDNRGYYRVGVPDIGAFEFGASKYLLALGDDIDNNDNQATTFVKLSDQIKYTITTNDINGNIVNSNEIVSWNIFPNDKYVKFVSGDINTIGGDASATFEVTEQARGKGFRFRIEIGVGDAILRSPLYVIEELVTGAPPPILDLKLTPDTWSNNPEFTLEWKTPTWEAQRDLIGAVVEISDGINDYTEYLGFPSGDTLTTFKFKIPEAGTFDTELWLVDELGNEDQDSSISVTAYFDDIPPSPFYIYGPNSYQTSEGNTEIRYSGDKPFFEWDDFGDYPSGLKEWQIYVRDKSNESVIKYGTYNRDDLRKHGPGSPPDLVYVQDEDKPLKDGYYDWWVVSVDSAGNGTSSDTGYFGVDISAPFITHNNPLTEIDENTTSPSIAADFSDGASGVYSGKLHYRRAGTGAGFVTVDLLGGPVNIPGSDIKSVGLEYYIDTQDKVGNFGKWPEDKAYQSVRIRTEDPVSTSGNLNLPGGTDSTNYIFFSIPYDVGNGLGAFKTMMDPNNSGPDEFKYRLYAYNNGWQENPSSLTMGNGYFFIFDPDKYSDILPLKFDFGQGVSAPTDPPYEVNIASGQWKFFGLPHDFNVSVSDIYTENGTSLNDAGSIYSWNGTWTSVGSTLQPWKGYIYKSGGDSRLIIDTRGSVFGKMAETTTPDNTPFNSDEWVIDMIARTGNSKDDLNSVGVRHIAEDGYDRLDEFEPPVAPGDISLRVDNRNRDLSPDVYAIDIRKPKEEGHYWDLQVLSPTNGDRTYLTFEGLGYIPQEYDAFLINKTNKQAKNLEWESTYRFANTGSKGYVKQDFRLVIGTKEFVEANNAGVNLYPDAFTLSQNYPNPFNPQTSIRISLEQDAQVDLIIYNLLGEEITRLAANEYRPAGYYNFIWNGRNSMGTKVSTGVYFYHAMIRNTQGKVVLNKTRKMIFLK